MKSESPTINYIKLFISVSVLKLQLNFAINSETSENGHIKFIYFELIVKFHFNEIKQIIRILLLTKHKTA